MLPAASSSQCWSTGSRSSACDRAQAMSSGMEVEEGEEVRSPAGRLLRKQARTGDVEQGRGARERVGETLLMGGGGRAAQHQYQQEEELRVLLHNLGGGATAAGTSLVRSNCTAEDRFLHAHESLQSPHNHLFLRAAAPPPRGAFFYNQHQHLSPLIASLNAAQSATDMDGRVVFTPGQLRELQHQALVLKYIMSGANVPADLVNPIRSSLAGIPPFAGFANLAWGGYRGGYGSNADPEPGRCRRTDGKKWRCSRDVVPEQKYCERHIHRGRHRSRKPANADSAAASQQTDGPSPAASAMTSVSSPMAPASPSIALHANPNPIGSHLYHPPPHEPHPSEQHQHHPEHQHEHHHQFHLHHRQQQQQQLSPNLGMRPYSGTNSPSASSLSVGSSITASQYNQMQLHAASKDMRYVGGMSSRRELGAEQQAAFAEASGTSRGIDQDFASMNQHGGGLSMFPSMNDTWRTPSLQQSRAASPTKLPYHHSPQIRSLIHDQDFNLMSTEMDPLSLHNMAQQSQQHHFSFLGSGGYGSVEAVGGGGAGREHESQPLRHFFDDWPRSKDASAALSWPDVEDGKPNRNAAAAATPHLSISIPMSESDFHAPPGSPHGGKSKLSPPLKLSMWRAGEDEIPMGMELGVGMGMGIGTNEDRSRPRQHQANLIPIAWETPVGGPLAEAFQSSTPRTARKASGLNLMTEGWEGGSRGGGGGSPKMSSSSAAATTRGREEARQGSSCSGSMEAASKEEAE